jgi:hypothetical protein
MKTPTKIPTIEQALMAVNAARAMLAEWVAPVCRGHLYPMRIRRGRKRYLDYTWEPPFPMARARACWPT